MQRNLLKIFFVLVVSLFYIQSEASTEVKIKIIEENAKVRLNPSIDSPVIGEVPIGETFVSEGTEGEWFRISFPSKDGSFTLSGFIHSRYIEVIGGEMIQEEIVEGEQKPPIKKQASQEIVQDTPSKTGNVYLSGGLGYGIPYGTLGMNCEFNTVVPTTAKFIDYFGLTAGVGYFRGGIKYAFGLRIYPFRRKVGWNPRLSAYYGTVAFYETWWGEDKNANGPAFGAGILWMSRSHISVDIEMQYRIPNLPSGVMKEEGVDFALSAGILYYF
jgi:hypothetical protein